MYYEYVEDVFITSKRIRVVKKEDGGIVDAGNDVSGRNGKKNGQVH